VVKLAVQGGVPVTALRIDDRVQADGVNSPLQLAELERAYQLRRARALMAQGVRLADPARFDVRGTLTCGADVEIDINCVFEGAVSLGDGVRIGANCVIANARIETGAVIRPYTHIDGETAGVTVGPGALVGPFARLRTGAELAEDVHVGNFVEVKNAILDEGVKVGHLSYIGDADVGEFTNIGAGTVTCNYDGVMKHRTRIGKRAFIGSDTMLVAPVSIGDGALTGSGSVITEDVPAEAVALARAKQVNKAGLATKLFERLRAIKAAKGKS